VAVANSTPLMCLVRLGKLDLLVRLFGRILIPEAVYREVVVRGEEAGHPEAHRGREGGDRAGRADLNSLR